MNKLITHSTIYSYLVAVMMLSGFIMPINAEELNTAGSVSRGAISWSQNCARCHEMRDPTEFRDDQWKTIVTHMRVRAGLTGQQQRDIIAFLQSANNQTPKSEKVAAPTVVTQPTSRSSLSGKAVYGSTCIACHGANGKGVVPGAPDFTQANGVLSKPDDVLLQHITQGFQSPGSPMAMPAKGGNPALTADELRTVLSYIRDSFGK